MNDRGACPRLAELVASRYTVKLLIDPEAGRLLDASEAAAEFYGLPREGLRQLSAWDLTPFCSRADTLTMLAELAAGRDPGLHPGARHRRHGGELREVMVYPDLVEHQGRVLILATVADVTELRQTQARLRQYEAAARGDGGPRLGAVVGQGTAGKVETGRDGTFTDAHRAAAEGLRLTEERLRLALEAARMGTWHWDIVTGEALWSDTCCTLFGVPPGTPSSWERFISSIHPEQREAAELVVRRALEAHSEYVHEYLIVWPDGSPHWILANGRFFFAEDGTPRRMEGVVVDITERRAMEDEIRALNAELELKVEARTAELQTLGARLQLATEAAGIGIWEYHLKSGELTWDAQVRAIYGLPAGQPNPTYRDWLSWLEPQDQGQIAVSRERIMRGDEPAQFKAVFRVHCPDGALRFIASHGRLLRDADGVARSMLGANWDVTAERQARDAAERAARAKSDFLAHMSHEIRTPMNAVLGLAQVLDRTPLAPDQRAMLGNLNVAGRSLLAILNQILDLSKIEAGHLSLEVRPFDLATLLTELGGLLEHTAREKGLTLTMAAPSDLSGALLGDPLRLEQVLANLIGNAIKFTEHGEVRLRICQSDLTEAGVRLRFEVTDTGIGMIPEARAAIFTPFTQADDSITRRFGGTGLGLSICKRLVELMGGEIGVESQDGRGSTFWFVVPFGRTARPQSLPGARRPTAPLGPRLSGRHLLVVDDSAMNRLVAERMLAAEGARVTPAGDGQSALECLRAEPRGFDAVLLDVQMSVMDGLTVTRIIRTELGLTELPVIALTAGVFPAQQAAALASGMNDVLTKPLDLERMVTLLLQWVRQRSGGPSAVAREPHPGPPALEPSSEGFPEIAGIDRASAARVLGGDRALFLDLLERFAEDFADVVARTRAALSAGDRATAARQMHTLSGDASALGALDLSAAARSLEAAIERRAGGLDGRLTALDTGIAALIAAAAPCQSAKHAKHAKKVSPVNVRAPSPAGCNAPRRSNR